MLGRLSPLLGRKIKKHCRTADDNTSRISGNCGLIRAGGTEVRDYLAPSIAGGGKQVERRVNRRKAHGERTRSFCNEMLKN